MADIATYIQTSGRTRLQTLRLIIALYIMGMALGAFPYAAGRSLMAELAQPHMATGLTAILLFTCAWLILTGKHLRRASIGLIVFITLARLHAPTSMLHPDLLRDAVLMTGLVLTGGFLQVNPLRLDTPGRIRLVHRALPRGTYPIADQPAADGRPAAFDQSPDDMMRLFDEIGEAR